MILMLGRFDISRVDYLSSWVNLALQVDSAKECAYSLGLSRLDRWPASELNKSLKGVPKPQFKVQGSVEGCARQGVALSGSAVAHMISKLDRIRAADHFSVRVFGWVERVLLSVRPAGVSSKLMKVLNQIRPPLGAHFDP